MKMALEAQGLKPHLMTQPLGFRTPDAGPYGWADIPEFPYGILSSLFKNSVSLFEPKIYLLIMFICLRQIVIHRYTKYVTSII